MRTKQENIELIKKLSNANGVSGFEDEVCEIAVEETKDYCDTKVDSLRNVYLNLKNSSGNKPKVWLDAHSDEVGFMIQAIRPDGMMMFLPIGGWSANNVPSSKVRVRNRDGKYVPGIVAAKPVHFMTQAEKNAGNNISNMVIDVGAISSEDIKNNFNIKIAAPVVPDVECTYDEAHDLFLGKAFDCRVGCAALIESLNQLKEEELDVDVVATLSVQEEVGERGTMAAVQNIDADICICFEGCPADDSFYPEYMIQAGIKRGPMIRHFDVSMISNPRFMEYTVDIANKYNIPLQEAVRSGGGTNAKYIHASRYGVPTIVIGIPVRYIHSHHGICTLEDYENAVKLAVTIVKDLNKEKIENM